MLSDEYGRPAFGTLRANDVPDIDGVERPPHRSPPLLGALSRLRWRFPGPLRTARTAFFFDPAESREARRSPGSAKSEPSLRKDHDQSFFSADLSALSLLPVLSVFFGGDATAATEEDAAGLALAGFGSS